MINQNTTSSDNFNARLHTDLIHGDWKALYQTTQEWLQVEPNQPVATFIQNIACLFISPPAIIRNKHYLETVNNKNWKAVLNWFKDFQADTDKHNPYFQAIEFILQPTSRKKDSIENALQENPHNAELLFLQAISLRDKRSSVEKLKLALQDKPVFPSASYLLGIFSLQLNDVQSAEAFLKQAVEMAPDFLEAHYQLGSLYTLYMPDAAEQSRLHFQRVIELDPDGGAARDARKVMETGSKPQYGQRIGGEPGAQRGGMSIFIILGISLLTVVLFSGPVAALFKITNPTVGILAGLFVFIGLYSAFGRRR